MDPCRDAVYASWFILHLQSCVVRRWESMGTDPGTAVADTVEGTVEGRGEGYCALQHCFSPMYCHCRTVLAIIIFIFKYDELHQTRPLPPAR